MALHDPPHILVVDDDETVRDTMKTLLSRSGHAVFTAASGDEALRRLPEICPDLVTLELALPGIAGLATLRRLRQRLLPDVRIIMLSGHDSSRIIATAMRLGADDFLRKPFEVAQLERALRKALAED